VALVCSLAAWAGSALGDEATGSAAGLPAACRNAEAQFRPITPTDVQQVKGELIDALDRLDARLNQDGANGEAWRTYLKVAATREALQADGAERKVLREIWNRYKADHDGLELVWFVDVQRGLDNYLSILAVAANQEKVRADFQSRLERLASALERYAAKPTTEDAEIINQTINWLQVAHQAPDLVHAIDQYLVQPNVYGSISAEIVGAGFAEQIDETMPIQDCILGTAVTTCAHTVGQSHAVLRPADEVAVIDTLFRGVAEGNSVGYHHPVTIYSSSTTELSACKRLWITQDGLSSHPSIACASAHIEVQDIQHCKDRQMIERMAWRRAGKQHSEAECIASSHAEQRLNERVDDRAAEPLERANRQYVEKFQRPFSERKLFPQMLRFSTTEQAISVVGLHAGGGKVGAPTAPPAVGDGDMTLRLHESMINNLAFDALAGRTVHEEKAQATAINVFGRLPEKMKGDEDGRPWAITFAARQPISVSFADNGYRITIRGVKYFKGGESYPATNVSATYKFQKGPEGFKLVRQGPIEVVSLDEAADRSRKTIIRRLLRDRFEKVFEPEVLAKGMELSGRWKSVGKLVPVEITARDGWLTIVWNRQPAPAVAIAAAVARKGV
jgi:hypothetical protein